MEAHRRHQLKPGTILDGRYEIGSVLGEGGFGITYSGVNVNTGEKVAIKEFFCRDYMDRDEGTGKTVLSADSEGRRAATERRRFLREARIIRDFRDEPNIVSVLDYFEENDTAYIVMELVEGTTLKRYILDNGRYDPKELFEELRPLMQALGKLHEAGLIHRDISPDNIVRKDDGQLVLIDFGSAKYLSSNTETTRPIFKSGYAPPEQCTGKGKAAAAIDVYGLSATMYYCLTNKVPLPSLQRLLFDELKPVSDMVPVPEKIDDMISRGMELKPQDRYGSIEEMLEIIDEVYPYLTPEEKERLRKKRNCRILAAVAAVLVLIGICAGHFIKNRNYYKVRTQDTTVLHFTWEDEETAEKSADSVRNRAEAFAGRGNFLFNLDGKEAILEIPTSLFGENNPETMAKYFFAIELSFFRFRHTDEYGFAIPTQDSRSTWFFSEDMESVKISDSKIPVGDSSMAAVKHLEIRLNEDAAKESSEFLTVPGEMLIIEDEGENLKILGFSEGDGRTFHLISRFAHDNGQLDNMVRSVIGGIQGKTFTVEQKGEGDFYEALKCSIEDDDSEYDIPECYCEMKIDWEKVSESDQPGEYQCDPENIQGERLVLGYTTWYTQEDKGSWLKMEINLKELLDFLQIPYAFGNDQLIGNRCALMVKKDALLQSEAVALTDAAATISNGIDYTYFTNVEVVKDKEGKAGLKLSTGAPTGIEDISNMLKHNRQYGFDKIYLFADGLGYYPVAVADSSEMIVTDKEASCVFRKFYPLQTDGKAAISDRNVDFLKKAIETTSYGLEKISCIELHGKDGKFEKEEQISDMEGCVFDEEKAFVDKIAKETGYEVSYSYDNRFRLRIKITDLPTDTFESDVAEEIERLLRKYDFFGNQVQNSNIDIFFTNDDSQKDDEQHKEALYVVSIEVSDKKMNCSVLYSKVHVWQPGENVVFDEAATEAAQKKMDEEMGKRSLLDKDSLTSMISPSADE